MWTFEQLFVLDAMILLSPMLAGNYIIKKVTDVENEKKTYWLFYLLLALIGSAVVSRMTIQAIISNGNWDYGIPMALFESAALVATVCLHHFLLRSVLKRIILFFTILTEILNGFLGNAYLGIAHWIQGEHVFSPIERMFFYSLQAFITFIVMWQFYRFICKTKAIHILRRAYIYPNFALIISGICFLQMTLLAEVSESVKAVSVYLYFFIRTISYLGVFVFLLFLAREHFREERLKRSEILLEQQKSYMEHLETVQQDLRKIHHDYKNVAAGLYAQVEAGELAAAQEYISKEFLQLDQGIQLSLQQHNQLLNVEVLELKTLFMAKIIQAEKMDVRLAIEVMEPVQHISMEIADLLRCGGILLDNAIEAAARTEEKEVYLVLLKEKETLTLIVKNTVSHPVDLQRIWEAGYSTKGDSRGLGLANLKTILQRYNHVVLETRVQENWFNQILFFQK